MRTKEIEEKLRRKDLGEVLRVSASFTFKAPDEEWLQGGNGRTDKSREPMAVWVTKDGTLYLRFSGLLVGFSLRK